MMVGSFIKIQTTTIIEKQIMMALSGELKFQRAQEKLSIIFGKKSLKSNCVLIKNILTAKSNFKPVAMWLT